MTDTIRDFAGDFPAQTAASWRVLAEKALRGADFETAVDRHTVDGLKRGPVFFDRPDGTGAVDTAPRDGHLPWGMRQSITEACPAEANAVALDDLMGGVSELDLRLDSTGRFGLKANEIELLDAALTGVDLSLAPVHLDSLDGQGHHAHLLLTLFARRRLDGEHLHGGLGLSPVERAARQGIALDDQCFPKARGLAELAQAAFPQIRIFRADAALAFEAGGSEVQELAVLAASSATYIRVMLEAGLSADEAAQAVEARLAADTDIHLTIAKLRAARRIFARIAQGFGASEAAQRLSLQVTTSGRMMSAKDPWTNMIRTACAGFAAAAGGADTITIRPFTDAIGRPTGLGRRVARNLHILLAEESHIGKVTDPAAGSYLHETLSDELAQSAWSLFQKIERRGGLVGAFADGWLQSEIAAVREKRLQRLADGKDVILGVTQHPDPHPKPVETNGSWPEPDAPEGALTAIRLATPFEGASS
ncbi:methylmalonyl-CoA mutase family protein [Maricaulis salignorans]|uniref:Methylmalonyl-CoA mutase n=1 Tax=Maricaulis salignorans TaxID=144026 RepID=A0A1G9VQE3_9PROT|nr:methylmalonyl-CoA mutase family protein [Maricaulis salignorans]SDM74350.1 methylmalonyl-CoA mutase [Maricaulis salignorans]